MQHKVINPWQWQDAYSFVQAAETKGEQRVVRCSGQASVDAEGNTVHVGDIRAQMNQVFDNIETVLKAAGIGLADVVRLNYYTTDVDALLANWDVIATRLTAAGCKTTSTLLGVTRLALPEQLVEFEATAVA